MILPMLGSLGAAIVGGLIAHLLTTLRDRASKSRDKRVEYLIEAYRRLERCSHRDYVEPGTAAFAEFQSVMAELESALGDIQLFGTPLQVELAQRFARDFAQHHSGSYDELLRDLRDSLRRELNLEQISTGILHLRFVKHRPAELP